MKTMEEIEVGQQKRLDRQIKAICTLIFLLATGMLATALAGCGKSDPPQDPNPVGVEGSVVKGTVIDEDGNPYPKTGVTFSKGTDNVSMLTNPSGNFEGMTKELGKYSASLVPPLSTEVVTKLPVSINVVANQTATVDFVIKPLPVEAVVNIGSADIFGQVRDQEGNLPTDDSEPLYAANTYEAPLGFLKPILAPDGHTVTLFEFNRAKGSIMATCDGSMTRVDMALEGLIPNGTYTVWLAFLKTKKTVGQAIEFNDWVYATKPPLGTPSGTENVLIADAEGKIKVTKAHSSCILTDEAALVIPVIYHINGMTFGGGEIPDAEQVVHLLIYFQ